ESGTEHLGVPFVDGAARWSRPARSSSRTWRRRRQTSSRPVAEYMDTWEAAEAARECGKVAGVGLGAPQFFLPLTDPLYEQIITAGVEVREALTRMKMNRFVSKWRAAADEDGHVWFAVALS